MRTIRNFLQRAFALNLFLVSIILLFLMSDAANGATLALFSAGGPYTVGETFTVQILLNTGGIDIDGVDIRDLRYDPALVEVQDENTALSGIQIQPGALMLQTIANTTDPQTGKITFSQITSGGTTYKNNADAIFATFRVKALKQGVASFNFDFQTGNTSDTNVASVGSDILVGVTNTNFTFSSPPDSTAPLITNIEVSRITKTSAVISWTTDEAATTQVDYGLTSAYGKSTPLDFALTATHSATLSELSAGTSYNYRVKSQDGSKNLSQSIDKTFTTSLDATTDTTPPSAITNFFVLKIGETSVDLSWTSPGDDGNIGTALSYDIRYATANITESEWDKALQATGEGNPQAALKEEKFTLIGLQLNTTYYSAIRATDEAGNFSSLSNIISFKTVSSEIPVAPPPSRGGGGGSSGGGSFAPSDTTPPPQVSGANTRGTYKQIFISWKNPLSSDWVRTILVRKENGPPTSLNDGSLVYQGTAEEFTDISVKEDIPYYYAIYTIDRVPNYSKGVLVFGVTKKENDTLSVNSQLPSNTLLAKSQEVFQSTASFVKNNNTLYIIFPLEKKKFILSNATALKLNLPAEQAREIISSEITDYILQGEITSSDVSVLSSLDTDSDELSNYDERIYGTDAFSSDTDRDGYPDGHEIRTKNDPLNPPSRFDKKFVERLKGKILLQVEGRGEAWYIYPVDGKRYFLRDGELAYQIMRKLSLGITNRDLNRIPGEGSSSRGDTAFVNRLKGKILLQVQSHGEAWYVHPVDGRRYYMKDGNAAYQIMRKFGLGAKNNDIQKIVYGVVE